MISKFEEKSWDIDIKEITVSQFQNIKCNSLSFISSQICKYMKSKDYDDKKELMEKLSVESRSVKELAKVVDRDVKTAVYIKEQHLKIDVEEVMA